MESIDVSVVAQSVIPNRCDDGETNLATVAFKPCTQRSSAEFTFQTEGRRDSRKGPQSVKRTPPERLSTSPPLDGKHGARCFRIDARAENF
jgi:hypothetical protein